MLPLLQTVTAQGQYPSHSRKEVPLEPKALNTDKKLDRRQGMITRRRKIILRNVDP